MDSEFSAGERFSHPDDHRSRFTADPGIWRTLGWELQDWAPGRADVAWNATAEYGFPVASGYVLQGGMVTALLDAAMANACWSVLDLDQSFLTADLRVEFLRPTRPGPLLARGTVVRRTRRVVFCAGRLEDVGGTVLAESRCTQAVMPAGEVNREPR